jgi:p21-activated kinase 1
MEAMYVDLQEDALWIRMELMERSLADVVALVEEGHLERIDEKIVARFACDVSARSP